MTNQPKECCEWNEAIEAAAEVATDFAFDEAAKHPSDGQAALAIARSIRSLKRAPSHQAGQEVWSEEEAVATIEAQAEALHRVRLLLEQSTTRIETLKEALRPLAEIELWRDTYPDAVVDADPHRPLITAADVRLARAALDDGGG